MRNHFWNIWRKEYVTSLREGHRCRKSEPEIVNVNDIVLIYDKSQPRHLWNLGRILELIRSKDGLLRAAQVKCGSSGNILSRPLNKLYPIERRKPKSDIDRRENEIVLRDENERESISINKANMDFENKCTNRAHLKRNAAIVGEIRRKYNDSDL